MAEIEQDQSELLFETLNRCIVDIYKTCYEELGYDLGVSNNEVEYHNFLIEDPIDFYGDINTFADGLDGTLSFKGGAIDGVFIPESVRRNQTIGKCPQEFIDGVTKASKITGIPVDFYIAFGALESGWRNCKANSSGYGGYFGQRASEGGIGTVFQQAQGKMVSIYKSALKDAQAYGFTGADLAVWCYLCHNAGNAGARVMLKALGNKLRHSDIKAYEIAAQTYVNTFWSKLSQPKKIAQINEKTLSIPKAYYIISQIK